MISKFLVQILGIEMKISKCFIGWIWLLSNSWQNEDNSAMNVGGRRISNLGSEMSEFDDRCLEPTRKIRTVIKDKNNDFSYKIDFFWFRC